MEKVTALFIAISPSHISNFESFLDSNKGEKRVRAILLNPGNFDFKGEKWYLVLNGNMDLSYRASGSLKKLMFQFKKLWGYKRFMKKYSAQIFGKGHDFYFCNLDDVLTNTVYHGLLKEAKSDFYVFEDGILNYYQPKRDLDTLLRKQKLAGLFGIPFHPIEGHPTNLNSEHIKKQYVRLPEKSILPEKSEPLPYPKIVFKPQRNTTLIIGQDIMHNGIEGHDYYVERLKKLICLVAEASNDSTKVVYKPHRNGDYSIAQGMLSEHIENYELFLSNIPVEECIASIRPAKIYSFESSAMLNLKLSLKSKEVQLFVLPFSTQENPMIQLYDDLGIKIMK